MYVKLLSRRYQLYTREFSSQSGNKRAHSSGRERKSHLEIYLKKKCILLINNIEKMLKLRANVS